MSKMLYKISRLSGRPTGYMLLPFGLPTEESVVLSRVSDEIPLGEGDVEDGGVIVDELEEVDLEREGVVVLGLRPVQLQARQPLRHVLVNLSGRRCTSHKLKTSSISFFDSFLSARC